MDGSSRKIRAFDLFCGAGGSSCGAQQAGAEIIGGIDLWDKAVQTFKANFPLAKVYPQRIDRRLTAPSVAREVGSVDLLMASPECTNHSVAKGSAPRDEDSQRTAFLLMKFVNEWKPRWVVVENVVSMQRWDLYGEWLRRLHRLGYKTGEFKLNAEDFGVPQSRRRLFVVADRERAPVEPPANCDKPVPVSRILHRGIGNNGYNYRRSPLEGRAQPTMERAERAILELGPKRRFLLVYYGSDAAGGWQKVNRPLRTITTLDRFALVVPKGEGHEMRMLQPPELARAMGFPADYDWQEEKITRREHIKLIGNAVSPPVMKAVVEAQLS